MRTIVCHEPHDLAIISREAPSAARGEILVRINRVGLCGTDYHIFAGRHPFLNYPRVMGHELSGTIVEPGNATSLRKGQLVAINPYLACGDCIACRKNKPNACVKIRVLGVHTDGGMCDLLAVPASAAIDAEGLTSDQAAMVEFLAVGAHAALRAPFEQGDRMLIVGAGPIGIATALFARLRGFEITLVDRSRPRLNFAKERLGFEGVATGDGLGDRLAEQTNGDMFEVVVDATGSLAAMSESLMYVAHGGALVLVGVAPGDLVISDPEFHKREATLIASRNALAKDFDRVVAAIRSGEIPTGLLHTHSLKPEEVPARFPELVAEADSVLKAIISFGD